ncbi:MAG: 2-aminoethylphosphonate--pyruvate transaminase [Verrucomicrobiales bacterium]|nr:2-aminoethylphosphonate--pyruvate transaminase [Verrucomicrobiales bacterium]
MPNSAHDKLLFTPGPLTTSLSVKQAMLHDAGSWHFEFNAIVAGIRQRLLALAGTSKEAGFECVLMQGSGSFGVESVLGSVIPPDGRALILTNGAYGDRIVQMARVLRLDHVVLRTAEDTPPTADQVREQLTTQAGITHVIAVHCETTTGILNPIETIGPAAREHGCRFIVDAMSSFGALPIDLDAWGVDYVISSANKCIEGVPGFSFVLARRESLLATEGWARSLCLDLLGQWKGFEKNGQFRYTPPTHALLAFQQALEEWESEGGVTGRGDRYRRNHGILMAGMKALGFQPYLPAEIQSPIITAFRHPGDPRFRFDDFYHRLSDRGMIIYPGKLTQVDTFRIGTIGRLFPADIEQLLSAIRRALQDMGCQLPLQPLQG